MNKQEAELCVQKARVQLILRQPFFANIVMRRAVAFTNAPEYTASIDLGGNIILGLDFISKLSVAQLAGLLAHEAMHYALNHGARKGWRDAKKFNIAADKVINSILMESGMELPEGGVFMQGASAFCAEQLYDDMEEDGDGEGEGANSHEPGHGHDDLLDDNAPADAQQHEEEVRQELAQAAQAAKATGNLPKSLETLINEMVNPPTPWHQLLDRWMTGMVRGDITWAKPRRQMMNVGYFPSQGKKPSLGSVVIVADSSGSIGALELSHFVGHVNSILEKCNPERVYFLHCDAKVHQVDEFTVEDLPMSITKLQGGGGTDMGKGLRWVEDNGIDCDVCIVLTDGYTPWPAVPPAFPLAVLCTSDIEVPIGEVIRYKITN